MNLLYGFADRLRHRAQHKRWTPERALGVMGEDLAHRHLQKNGLIVVARNYRPSGSGGEIDLIAWEGERLVFIEVKTRGTDDYGSPERFVDANKREYLERSAREYVRRAGIDWKQTRFDILAVLNTHPPQLNWIRDAFGARASL